MANTLTGLIPTINAGLNVVSRELIGFIPNVSRDSTAEEAAVGQTVRSPIAPQGALEDIVAGNNPADSGDATIDYVDVGITKSKAYPIRWNGEEQMALTKDGLIDTILLDQFTNGFRTIANAVEADLGAEYANASRAYGTAGTTPFATADDHSDFAEVNRILDDNGAPAVGRAMVVGSAARAKLEGKQANLFKVNESGDAGALLRERQMRNLHGFTMGFSAGVADHTAGSLTANVTVTGVNAIGTTSIGLTTDATGDVAFAAGEIITIAGDTNKYVVAAAVTIGNSTTGTVVIGKNGLRVATAGTEAVSLGASYTANQAFSRDALMLAARMPAMPKGGDSADDVTVVVDPLSGLAFQIALYKQYRQIKFEIGLAWGTAAPNPSHLATLLG